MCYGYAFKLPFLYFTLIRSSASMMFTVVGVVISLLPFIPLKKRIFTKIDFGQTLLVTVGVLIFQMQFSDKKELDSMEPLLYSVAGLILEAVGGHMIQHLKDKHQVDGIDVMFVSSIVGFLVSASFWYLTGEYAETLNLFQHSWEALTDQLVVSIATVFGTYFRYSLIHRRGYLASSIVMTSRKIFTAFLSVFLFDTPMSLQGYLGSGLVISAIVLELFGKQLSSSIQAKPKTA